MASTDTIFLVGYGTLLNRSSLGNTIGSEKSLNKAVTPIIVHDYKRLFNLRPDHYEPGNLLQTTAEEAAAMNVEPAPGFTFNALGFPVTLEELEKLDARERYYHRQVVPVYDFTSGEQVGEGHVYVSAPDARWIRHDIEQLLPLWRDIVWAREGAYRISRAFGQHFDATTYLADGRTLIVDFYRAWLDQSSSPIAAARSASAEHVAAAPVYFEVVVSGDAAVSDFNVSTWTQRLYDEIHALRGAHVSRVSSDDQPDGSMSSAAIALGALAIAVLPTLAPALIDLLKDWSLRNRQAALRIRRRIGDQEIEVEFQRDMTPEELQPYLDFLLTNLSPSDADPTSDLK